MSSYDYARYAGSHGASSSGTFGAGYAGAYSGAYGASAGYSSGYGAYGGHGSSLTLQDRYLLAKQQRHSRVALGEDDDAIEQKAGARDDFGIVSRRGAAEDGAIGGSLTVEGRRGVSAGSGGAEWRDMEASVPSSAGLAPTTSATRGARPAPISISGAKPAAAPDELGSLMRRVGFDPAVARLMTGTYGRPRYGAAPAPAQRADPWRPDDHKWERPMHTAEAEDPREITINRAAQALLEASRPPPTGLREPPPPPAAIDVIPRRKPASRIAAEAAAAAADPDQAAPPPLRRGFNTEAEKRKLQATFAYRGGKALPESGLPAPMPGHVPLHLVTGKGPRLPAGAGGAPRSVAEIAAAAGLPPEEAALLSAATPDELSLVAEAQATLRDVRGGIAHLRAHIAEMAHLGATVAASGGKAPGVGLDAEALRRAEGDLADHQREASRIMSLIGEVRAQLQRRVATKAAAAASAAASAARERDALDTHVAHAGRGRPALPHAAAGAAGGREDAAYGAFGSYGAYGSYDDDASNDDEPDGGAYDDVAPAGGFASHDTGYEDAAASEPVYRTVGGIRTAVHSAEAGTGSSAGAALRRDPVLTSSARLSGGVPRGSGSGSSSFSTTVSARGSALPSRAGRVSDADAPAAARALASAGTDLGISAVPISRGSGRPPVGAPPAASSSASSAARTGRPASHASSMAASMSAGTSRVPPRTRISPSPLRADAAAAVGAPLRRR